MDDLTAKQAAQEAMLQLELAISIALDNGDIELLRELAPEVKDMEKQVDNAIREILTSMWYPGGLR